MDSVLMGLFPEKFCVQNNKPGWKIVFQRLSDYFVNVILFCFLRYPYCLAAFYVCGRNIRVMLVNSRHLIPKTRPPKAGKMSFFKTE